jgi:hypothetical protein
LLALGTRESLHRFWSLEHASIFKPQICILHPKGF